MIRPRSCALLLLPIGPRPRVFGCVPYEKNTVSCITSTGPPHTRRAFVNESAGHAAAHAGAAAATIPRGRHPEVLMQVFAESPQSLLRFFAPVAGRAQAADERVHGA